MRPFNAPPTPDFRPLLGPSGFEPRFQADDALQVYNAAFRAGRVTASGISGRDGNYTTYGTTTGHSTIAWNREFYPLGLNDQALMTLHESLHLYNNFTDFAIADAAHMHICWRPAIGLVLERVGALRIEVRPPHT
jgi:hypothetical protein